MYAAFLPVYLTIYIFFIRLWSGRIDVIMSSLLSGWTEFDSSVGQRVGIKLLKSQPVSANKSLSSVSCRCETTAVTMRHFYY